MKALQLSGFSADAEFCDCFVTEGKFCHYKRRRTQSRFSDFKSHISADTALCHSTLNPLKSNTLSRLSEPSCLRERRQSEKETPPSPPAGRKYPKHTSEYESILIYCSALQRVFRVNLKSGVKSPELTSVWSIFKKKPRQLLRG